ncbi:MAG: carbamoyltransferase [Deltaproteobacteria bacterium]|nr:carbamoyltransferase [Deltaproteobacteria bacterium]
MVILGINAYHGDASAALILDGRLVAAAEEERFNRIKHSAGFPTQAVRYCLRAAGIEPHEINYIASARDPRARIWRKAWYALRMPRLALDRLGALTRFAGIKEETSKALGVESEDIKAEVHRVEHHKAHLASSFFVSPFEEAALLSADGLGDFASTMWGVGTGSTFNVQGSITFPHSLGIYYTALTQYLGFWKYGDEYKVMGLAAYGEPEYEDRFHEILQLDGRLGFSLGLNYFIHHKTGPEMTWREGEPVLGRLYGNALTRKLGPERQANDSVEKRHQNIAASLQARLEDAMFLFLNKLYERTKLKTLCLAGGVAFNCVVNGQIFDRTPFEKVYIQPAPGDAGLAVGAAFYVWHQILGRPRGFEMKHAYWGPEFSNDVIKQLLVTRQVRYYEFPNYELLCQYTAKHIAEGNVVGWFQGRMEWGPRALGNRSILVDPRRSDMKDILNSRIKRREPFRPFAPSVLEERVGDFFEKTHPSPFMLMTYKVKPEKRSLIPAPTHVDGTGRLQTVSRDASPRYWELIKEFETLTGVPVLLNTSFNENEPIVCTPAEALDCFLRTKMDVLVLKNCFLEKETA